jgi:pyruvate formate lyase activating enzyme
VKIGGFQSITLSDFPGMPAAIVFTQGCNYRCPFCHNGSLLDTNAPHSRLLDEQKVFEALKSRKNILDGLVITGGEPTIQPDLSQFIKAVRKIGYKIKLDTNGSRPDVIENLVSENVLDYIAMDIKAPLNKYSCLSGVRVEIKDILKSIEIISNAKVISEFRTTFVPELLTESDIESIRSLIPIGSKYTIQEFIPENAWKLFLRKTYHIEHNDTDTRHLN